MIEGMLSTSRLHTILVKVDLWWKVYLQYRSADTLTTGKFEYQHYNPDIITERNGYRFPHSTDWIFPPHVKSTKKEFYTKMERVMDILNVQCL